MAELSRWGSNFAPYAPRVTPCAPHRSLLARRHGSSRSPFSACSLHRALPQIDPFLFLDFFSADLVAGETPPGNAHPHRGFETVTFVLEGEMGYRDSLGNKGVLATDSVEWMTAGSGIVHDGHRDHEFARARRSHHRHPAVGEPAGPLEDDLTARPLSAARDLSVHPHPRRAGAGVGRFGPRMHLPVDVKVPVTFLDYTLEAGASVTVPVPAGWNAFAQVCAGTLTGIPAGALVHFTGDGALTLTAGPDGVRTIVGLGEPIGEPVVAGGPFVMNTGRRSSRPLPITAPDAWAGCRTDPSTHHSQPIRGVLVQLPLIQVDAFAPTVFSGNPAAVVRLGPTLLPDHTLQQIAAGNNLSETAFVTTTERPGVFGLRWFTPTVEVDLCGHATLAAGSVVLDEEGLATVGFETRSGPLHVSRDGTDFAMDLPRIPWRPTAPDPAVDSVLGARPHALFAVQETHSARYRMARFASAEEIAALRPDTTRMGRELRMNIIVTAPGDTAEVDFVSRFFAPGSGVPEDPVTGSTHCTLAPYWAGELSKHTLVAEQRSTRGGRLQCRVAPDRVTLSGPCTRYLVGCICGLNPLQPTQQPPARPPASRFFFGRFRPVAARGSSLLEHRVRPVDLSDAAPSPFR